MENEPKSSDDGDGVSQKEGKKRKADESQDVDIAKKLKGLLAAKLTTSELSMLSELIKQRTPEVVGNTESITLDGQGGSSEEEGAAAVSGKSDTNTKYKTADDVAKKQATLSDSPGTSPRRRAKMNASYMETTRSDESETERDDMKQVAVQKEAALKKGSEVVEVERAGQGNDTSDIESGDEQGDSVIESRGRRVAVVVYSPNVDLSNDEQHESIEQKGKCTIIANAVRLLKDQECRQTYGFEVLFGK